MQRNEQFEKELATVKPQIDHLLVENQSMSSTSSGKEESQSVIIKEINPLEYIMKQVHEEMITLHKAMAPLYKVQKGP